MNRLTHEERKQVVFHIKQVMKMKRLLPVQLLSKAAINRIMQEAK